jgi:hypothetical protein
MSRSPRVLAALAAAALVLLAFPTSSTAVDGPDATTAASAVAWLKTQVHDDGGFEGPFSPPGFETTDAALAIMEQAQTSSTWSTTAALQALQGVHTDTSDKTPLDYLDALAGGLTANDKGKAAQLIAFSAFPLGLDPTAYDPAQDGSPTDLVALLDSGCGANTASFGPPFNNTLYALMAKRLVCGSVPQAAVATVLSTQQADGGWNFDGDPSETGADPDETGLALMALAASGLGPSNAAVQHGLALLASSQQSSGSWIDFFGVEGNASSTSLVVLGITASGYDAQSSCWRDTVAPNLASSPYSDPVAWIRSQHQSDGHIRSPYDNFGVNTLTTSQSVEGLLRSWLPIAPSAAQHCAVAPPVVSTTTPTAGSAITVSGGGFAPNTALTIELHSTPVVLATTTSDGSGNYSVTIVIPSDTPPGVHQIVTTGLGPSGQVLTSSVTITVEAETVAQPVVLTPTFTG